MRTFCIVLLSFFAVGESLCQSDYFDKQIKKINKAISNGDFETAKKYLDLTEMKFPDSSRVFLEKAGYYYFQDSLNAAMSIFLKAEAMGSPNVQLNKYVGMLHHRADELEQAQTRYADYLTAVPEDLFIWAKYALILFETEQYDKLLAECEGLDTTNTLSAPIYGMLCNVYTTKSEHDKALEKIRIARRLQPFNQQWQYYEAVVHHNLEDFNRSCDMMHTLMNNGYFEYYSTYETFDCDQVLDVEHNDNYEKVVPPTPPPPMQEIIKE